MTIERKPSDSLQYLAYSHSSRAACHLGHPMPCDSISRVPCQWPDNLPHRLSSRAQLLHQERTIRSILLNPVAPPSWACVTWYCQSGYPMQRTVQEFWRDSENLESCRSWEGSSYFLSTPDLPPTVLVQNPYPCLFIAKLWSVWAWCLMNTGRLTMMNLWNPGQPLSSTGT